MVTSTQEEENGQQSACQDPLWSSAILGIYNQDPLVSYGTIQQQSESHQMTARPTSLSDDVSSEGNLSLRGEEKLDDVKIDPDRGPSKDRNRFSLFISSNIFHSAEDLLVDFVGEEKMVADVKVVKYEGNEWLGKTPAWGKEETVTAIIKIKTPNRNGAVLALRKYIFYDEEVDGYEAFLQKARLQWALCDEMAKHQPEINERRGIMAANSDTFGFSEQGGQLQPVDLLRRVVYTAARIGVGTQFIKVLFSTSTGLIVFQTYKNKDPLPEDVAYANGHDEIAAFFRGITERFSKEDERSQMETTDINWHELARAIEKAELSGSSDAGYTSGFVYSGDTELSSSEDEVQLCSGFKDSVSGEEEDQLEPKVSLGNKFCEAASCGPLPELRRLTLEDDQGSSDAGYTSGFVYSGDTEISSSEVEVQLCSGFKDSVSEEEEDQLEPKVSLDNKFCEAASCGPLPELRRLTLEDNQGFLVPDSIVPPNIPHFVGRQEECGEILDHLTNGTTRLVNICGAPGFGKTAVAINVAHHLRDKNIPVYFVSLRGVESKDELVSKLLSIFSGAEKLFPLSSSQWLIHCLQQTRNRPVLILDDADDLLESKQLLRFLDEVLANCKDIKLLLTTRVPLDFLSHMLPIHLVNIDVLDEVSSASLVRLLLPNVSTENCSDIIKRCGQVPLYMRLMCNIISEETISINELLDEVEDSTLLEDLDISLPNFDYLKSVLDTSFQKLSTHEKVAFVSLAVFPYWFGIDEATVVLGLNSCWKTKKIIRSLERKSLIDCGKDFSSFRMHSLLRSFVDQKRRDDQTVEAIFHSAQLRLNDYHITMTGGHLSAEETRNDSRSLWRATDVSRDFNNADNQQKEDKTQNGNESFLEGGCFEGGAVESCDSMELMRKDSEDRMKGSSENDVELLREDDVSRPVNIVGAEKSYSDHSENDDDDSKGEDKVVYNTPKVDNLDQATKEKLSQPKCKEIKFFSLLPLLLSTICGEGMTGVAA